MILSKKSNGKRPDEICPSETKFNVGQSNSHLNNSQLRSQELFGVNCRKWKFHWWKLFWVGIFWLRVVCGGSRLGQELSVHYKFHMVECTRLANVLQGGICPGFICQLAQIFIRLNICQDYCLFMVFYVTVLCFKNVLGW